MDQQIAAIRAALAAVEAAIAQTQAALAMAGTPQDMAALRAVLVDLKAERAKLQFQLANLEAAAVVVQPLPVPGLAGAGMAAFGVAAAPAAAAAPATGARAGRIPAKRRAELKALKKELTSAVADRSIVTATIAFANGVIDKARRLRQIGDGEEPSPVKARQRASGARRAKARPAARRTTRRS
jgi:16S rRNA G1207 methylase RsmC